MGRTQRQFLYSLWVWSCCAHLMQCMEPAGQFCEGLNNCYRISMGVYQGSNQSLKLNLNPEVQKILKKCDPKTNTWEEKLLAVHGRPNFLTDKTTSVSLVNGNFTVQNAEKTEEGLYKIEQYLDNSCLAVVNVTLLDPPLSMAVTPSNVTETPEAFPPGTVYTVICVAIFVFIIILIAIGFFFIRPKCIKKKSKHRLPSQQEESTIVYCTGNNCLWQVPVCASDIHEEDVPIASLCRDCEG